MLLFYCLKEEGEKKFVKQKETKKNKEWKKKKSYAMGRPNKINIWINLV